MNRLHHLILPKSRQLCCSFSKYLYHRRWNHTPSMEPSSTEHIKPLSVEELQNVVMLMENDPRILLEVIAHLEPQIRRRLIVAGGAMEWFGKENAAKEVEKADIDNDRTISPKDFDHWFIGALKQRMEQQRRREAESAEANKNELCKGLCDNMSSIINTITTSSSSSSSSSKSVVNTNSIPAEIFNDKEMTSTKKDVSEQSFIPEQEEQELPLQQHNEQFEHSEISGTPIETTLATSSQSSSTSSLSQEKPLTHETKTLQSPQKMTKPTFNTTLTKPQHDDSYVPMSSLFIVAIEAGLPFVGFGLFDNATMLLAGDMIDGSVGFYLNCSVLASAAMGNICSGLFGMQVHGLIDRAVQKLFHRLPTLTESQLKNKRVFLAGQLGGTLGIMLGLILGMFPLLFIDTDTNTKSDYAMFQHWDVGSSGFIELPELEQVLAELGLGDTRNVALRVVSKYGEDNKLSYQEYKRLKNDLRKGKPVFEEAISKHYSLQ